MGEGALRQSFLLYACSGSAGSVAKVGLYGRYNAGLPVPQM